MSGPDARTELAQWLARVSAADPAVLAAAPRAEDENIEESGLDVRTHAMVCLAALVAAGAHVTAYEKHVATALDHGVTLQEIGGLLIALLPTAGAARVTAAAPAILAAVEAASAEVPARSEPKSA